MSLLDFMPGLQRFGTENSEIKTKFNEFIRLKMGMIFKEPLGIQ